jgi:hypothetical protein
MKSGQSWIAISPRSRGRSWRSSLVLKIADNTPPGWLRNGQMTIFPDTPLTVGLFPLRPPIFSRRVSRMIGEKTLRELVYETNRDVIAAYIPADQYWIDTRTRRK